MFYVNKQFPIRNTFLRVLSVLLFADNMTLNNFLKMFFGNANFAGAITAFFLDNTVPGK